eukprot:TRINITY_DN368_c1_g1_i1.p1 TRINITY_DN368_c1_g1~~TRINITY_DN368_c1_g1_i1.p1  ORF type:complete len:374 (+),score=78.69 TRINITY_DN368_c1_g1_i1:148-1122(+)
MSFQARKTLEVNNQKIEDFWAGDLPEQAQEVLDIFHFPDVYEHYGSQVPKGVLLHGLPGTGKTYFAKIIAELSGADFFCASASQFDEVFVGKGAQRIRALFDAAKEATKYTWMERFKANMSGIKLPQKKAVIFIDELDAIGTRNSGIGGTQSSTHATVSQLLTCLDGLDERGNIFVFAATNNISQIDPAIRRSGRFDRIIEMPLPNKKSRLQIIKFYLSGRPGFEDLEREGVLQNYARLTEDFSCADLKNFTNEAIMDAVKQTINQLKSSSPTTTTTSNTSSSTRDNEHVLTAYHLQAAYVNVCKKLQKERPSWRPPPLTEYLD